MNAYMSFIYVAKPKGGCTDAVWNRYTIGGRMNTISPEWEHGGSGEVRATLIQLGPQLWLDLDSAIIIRDQEEILLTAREVHVLSILVQVMRHTRSHISAQAIAERIGLTDNQDPGHCIEENISSIRRK